MAQGNLQGYTGTDALSIRNGEDIWILAFNNIAAATAFTNGDVVVLSGLSKNSGEAASTNYPTITVPATSATPVTVQVGVVDNSPLGLTTIAAGAWGYVQIKGFCAAVTKTTASNPIAVDDYVTAVNGVKTASTDGTSGSTSYTQKSFAVAKSVVGSGVAGTFSAYLFGHEVTI